ncbi:trichohyalin [Drosophila mojavensis]|uniref:Cilia- and flagella-associated protein 45 n=1 Tax=Drosophila mojavensis TaxID=7230 RepID=B4L1F9_DROMO|nr:trichohyalin [Drosophila mojavensis]EDW06680.1 uncharacterized protein Dmoj_GI15308 [Drosophila mojavensis]
MPTMMPCVTGRGRPLHADCYDRRGRKIGLELEKPIRLPKPEPSEFAFKRQPRVSICEKQLAEGLLQQREGFLMAGKRSSKHRLQPGLPPGALPPGTVAPKPVRLFPQPKPTKRKGLGGEATYFHVQGRPWESIGYATLEKEHVDRLKSSRPPTAEEIQAEVEQLREEERQNKEEENRMRSYYHEIDEARRERELEVQRQIDAEAEDDDAEKAAEAKRLMVLHKSLQARHENDVRVQSAIRSIGAAKCSAMWTAQIEERAMMERLQAEHDVEQARKDTAFNESKWGSAAEQDLAAHNKRLAFGNAVRQQINDHRQLRHMAEERRREESRQMRDAYEEYKRFQADHAVATGQRKKNYRNELFHYIKLHQDFGRILCEQEQRDELRANKYVIEKEAKRLEQRQQKAAIDLAKERKREALYVMQQKILDANDNREEMRLLAEHERLERKYRLEERQAVEKRRRQAEELRQGNLEAMANINKLRACYYAQRQREMDEMKVDRAKYEEQQKIELEKKLGRKLDLHEGVTAQMEEHERARRREIENERLESEKARAMEKQRQKEIDMVISVKLNELAKKKCMPQAALQSLTGRVTHAREPKLSAHFLP